MPLETVTYVADLVPSNPAGSDQRKQGDDHLRIIKSALQATFPGANKPFYVPKAETVAAGGNVPSSAANKTYFVDTAASNVTLTLPSLAAGEAGWTARFIKMAAGNVLTVKPLAGTISGVAQVTVGGIYDTIDVVWSGSTWLSAKVQITTADLVDLAVTTSKIADNAVTWAKVQETSVGRFLGRATVDPDPVPAGFKRLVEEMTPEQAVKLLPLFTAHLDAPLRGVVPGPLDADVSAKKFLRADKTWAGAGAPSAVVVDEKTASTDGGSFTLGIWVTRALNKIIHNEGSFLTLTADEFTLPAGQYYIEWSAPGYRVNNHMSRLYNVTGNVVEETGTSELAGVGDKPENTAQTRSTGQAVVSHTANRKYRIEHRCKATKTTDGLGAASGVASPETYTVLKVWRA